MYKDKPIITVIVGPTASGKTQTAINFAKITNSEIINADSRQIYCELCVGTAKPKEDNTKKETPRHVGTPHDGNFIDSFPPLYSRGGLGRSSSLKNETNALPLTPSFKEGEMKIDGIIHYGVDLCSIKDDFNAVMFRDYFNEKAKLILAKGKNVILTGGTGFYIDICMNGLANIPPPQMDIKIQVNDLISKKGLDYAVELLRKNDKITQLDEKNPRRVARALEVFLATKIPLGEWQAKTDKNNEYDFKIFGLKLNREILYQRINERVLKMISDGMIEEAKFLKSLNLSNTDIKKAGIGYDHLIKFLGNEIFFEEAIEKIQQDTRNYAKRQITWFKRYKDTNWIDVGNKSTNETVEKIKYFMRPY